MKPRNIFLLIAIIVAIVSIFYSLRESQDQSAYIDEIKVKREDKDRFMRTSPESPFKSNPASYKGLNYYPADVRYKVTANLTPIKDKKAVSLMTNDGNEQHYVEYAYAEFDLNGLHNKLLILEVMDMGPFRGKLFLAFGDETSAVDTYGAGRYLDVTKTPGNNSILLDFNLAYNPYCAYIKEYSCPFPPPENLLNLPIPAGEKNYQD